MKILKPKHQNNANENLKMCIRDSDKGTPTGDHFDPMLWGFLLLGSAAALAGLVIRRRRKGSE